MSHPIRISPDHLVIHYIIYIIILPSYLNFLCPPFPCPPIVVLTSHYFKHITTHRSPEVSQLTFDPRRYTHTSVGSSNGLIWQTHNFTTVFTPPSITSDFMNINSSSINVQLLCIPHHLPLRWILTLYSTVKETCHCFNSITPELYCIQFFSLIWT